ncbi:hypothetical protein IGI04_030300 [Brassica rapa subsp. trilocularis]|uniref:Uncharacterized protein n=1 Tax=Brassica rapa subsp. trilocularis TaxID=1813537 RepID=A0ABQ7LQB0_BRACM|nr:hypothetical protein IGI04_030300 [Brassica rapa subsp. trilocularis]
MSTNTSSKGPSSYTTSIGDPKMDKDHYPWIIWYLWKVRNDKLFIGIDRDPLELIRYVQGECQAWFSEK